MMENCYRNLISLSLLLLVSGCLAPQPPVVRLSDRVQLPDKSAVIFFVDGMDRARMHELLVAGELPGIQKHFVEGGVAVEHAIVAMPAITYPNSVSLLTGCFPGHHGVMGNLWFDRSTLELPDYVHLDSFYTVNGHFRHNTIYEILDDKLTVSVQFHTRRGVTHSIDNTIPAGFDWYTHNHSGVDRRVGYNLRDIVRLADRERRWPTVMTFYFPGVDEVGHRHGSDSQRYAEALQVADRSIGMVCDAIKASSLVDRTYFVLLTDHNHIPTPPDRHFDLAEWLEAQAGLTVRRERLTSTSFEKRRRQMMSYDAVLLADAGRRATIHLRGPAGWADGADPARVEKLRERLVDLPAVDLAAAARGTDEVRVTSKTGAGVIERRLEGSVAFYRLRIERSDPLGYLGLPQLKSFVEEGWHDSRSWLAATAAADYPDFVPQVVEMFSSPRAGDIVVFAAEDWSFERDRSGHGSAKASDMRVPLYFAGPDLPPGGRIECARLVDIMPTVLDLLGEANRLRTIEPIDGVSVAEALRHARQPGERSAADAGAAVILSHPSVQPADVPVGGVGLLELGR